jgi:hypothetical protein
MAIRIKARGGETAEQMLRRFKKLCEKEGLTKAPPSGSGGPRRVRPAWRATRSLTARRRRPFEPTRPPRSASIAVPAVNRSI